MTFRILFNNQWKREQLVSPKTIAEPVLYSGRSHTTLRLPATDGNNLRKESEPYSSSVEKKTSVAKKKQTHNKYAPVIVSLVLSNYSFSLTIQFQDKVVVIYSSLDEDCIRRGELAVY